MHAAIAQQRFCNRESSVEEVLLIQEVVDSCGGVSRNELANTVCGLLDWKRPNGGLKTRECLDLLGQLESKGIVKLSASTAGAPDPLRYRPEKPYR